MLSYKPLLAAAALAILPACSTVYYNTLEKVGIEKREVLVDRVKNGRKAQTEAQKEFKDGLEEFQSVVRVDGGDLEKKYNRLSNAYDDMEDEAEDVRDRIADIERVGKALFREWERELDQYSDPSLRSRSQQQLTATKARYDQVVGAMNRAADRMTPVLQIYNDQVLYLKHNLNARAIASLEAERIEIETRVQRLISEMDYAIAEANAFINEMSAAA